MIPYKISTISTPFLHNFSTIRVYSKTVPAFSAGIRPDIRVNGSDNSVRIAPGSDLSVSISIDDGSGGMQNADWWVVKYGPSGWSYMDISGGSIDWKQGLSFTHQGRSLISLPLRC